MQWIYSQPNITGIQSRLHQYLCWVELLLKYFVLIGVRLKRHLLVTSKSWMYTKEIEEVSLEQHAKVTKRTEIDDSYLI